MNLANKSFRDNKTGEIIKVIDSFENIAILENKAKIDTRRLLDQNLYTEQIDPSNFFNNQGAYNSLFEKIKTLPTDNLPFDDGQPSVGQPVVRTDSNYQQPVDNDSAIVYSSVDDEKAELARKYGASIDNTRSLAKQNEAFTKILGDEAIDELPVVPNRPIQVEEPVQRVEINRDNSGEVTGSVIVNGQENIAYEKQYSVPVEDPVYTMFKGIKRSVEFSLDLNLENKIPKLEFIEMMEDSYEKSIIDFLANDITQSILNNPQYLRDKIKEKINEMVYNKKPSNRKPVAKKPVVKKPVVKKPVAKKPVTKKPVASPELKEDLKAITETKKKTTRTKKETEQHD
jgi:hypothetical protein